MHLAEAVIAMVVGAGDPDDEVWGKFIERVGEGFEKLLEIHLALDVADSFDIKGAGYFFCGVIFSDMDGVSENAWIVAKECGRTVALVCVGIDDHDFDVGLLVLEIPDCDGDVVENAVTLAVFAEGVVGAASEADADAFCEGCIAGEASGFDLCGRACEEVA